MDGQMLMLWMASCKWYRPRPRSRAATDTHGKEAGRQHYRKQQKSQPVPHQSSFPEHSSRNLHPALQMTTDERLKLQPFVPTKTIVKSWQKSKCPILLSLSSGVMHKLPRNRNPRTEFDRVLKISIEGPEGTLATTSRVTLGKCLSVPVWLIHNIEAIMLPARIF